jgi:outer membrane protein assembly factor BamD (BamD/ComL family)
MKRLLPAFLLAALCLSAAFLAVSCKSAPPVSTEGLSAAEIFQRAQDAAEKGDSTAAIRYYEAYKQMRPDDRERGAWASYEIAFLYFKEKDEAKALALIEALLAEYAADPADLPPGPRILADKLKARIQAENPPKAPPKG